MNYVSKYKISDEKLKQQYVSDLLSTTVDQYPKWLQARAETLALEGGQA